MRHDAVTCGRVAIDVGGIEPRYALRINHKNEMFQDLAFGGG
jgi:hypothetical protein